MSDKRNDSTKYVHGNNINTKLNRSENTSSIGKTYLSQEIVPKYNKWKSENEKLKGPYFSSSSNEIKNIITRRTELLNDYKNFIDQKKYADVFDSRSNLQSSVLEEFMYYLFKDISLENNKETWVGKAHAFKDIFLKASSFKSMLSEPNIKFETKDEDFIIGSNINTSFKVHGTTKLQTEDIQIPAVGIECKTYIDKNMLGEISMTAEQLKYKNPNALYIVVSEWIKLSGDVNFQKYKLDQIYILRKQKNTDRDKRFLSTYQKNPIYEDVIESLFNYVKDYLNQNWAGSIDNGLTRGYLM